MKTMLRLSASRYALFSGVVPDAMRDAERIVYGESLPEHFTRTQRAWAEEFKLTLNKNPYWERAAASTQSSTRRAP